MLIQGDLKNLRPMQCYIREDPKAQKPEEVCQHKGENPFLAGGPVSEDGDKELWFLSLWREQPTVGLTEEVEAVYEGDIRPVPLGKPLNHLRVTLFGVSCPALGLVVATYHKVVHEPGHFLSLLLLLTNDQCLEHLTNGLFAFL